MPRKPERYFLLGTDMVPDWPAVVLVRVVAGMRWAAVQKAVKALLRVENGDKPVGWDGIFIWPAPGGELCMHDAAAVRKEQQEFFDGTGVKYRRYEIDANGWRKL